jgi:hypothetical protein
VAARAVVLLGCLLFAAVEGEHAAGEVGERFEVADGLEIVARQQRRKAKLLGLLRGPPPSDERRERLAHLLEVAAASVDAGDAGLDQQSLLDELRRELSLLGRGRAQLGHQTSLAISSRLAFV